MKIIRLKKRINLNRGPVLLAGFGLKAAKRERTSPSPVIVTTFKKDEK